MGSWLAGSWGHQGAIRDHLFGAQECVSLTLASKASVADLGTGLGLRWQFQTQCFWASCSAASLKGDLEIGSSNSEGPRGTWHRSAGRAKTPQCTTCSQEIAENSRFLEVGQWVSRRQCSWATLNLLKKMVLGVLREWSFTGSMLVP